MSEQTINPIEAQLSELRKELAGVRKELSDLRQFYNIIPAEGDKPALLNLRCCILTLADPDRATEAQAMFAASADGPYLSMFGKDGRARLHFSIDGDAGFFDLKAKGGETAVLLHAQADSERGEAVVFDAGKPAVALKSTPPGGAVVVLHEDGTPRAVMHSKPDSGEVLVLDSSIQPVAKMFASEFGGVVAVSPPGGQPAALMSAGNKNGGAVMVMDRLTNQSCSMMTGNNAAALMLNGAGDDKPTVVLMSSKTDSSIRVSDAAGNPVVELSTEKHGGALTLRDTRGRDTMRLHNLDIGANLTLNFTNGDDDDTSPAAILAVQDDHALLLMHNQQGEHAALQMTKGGGCLNFANARKELQLVLGFEGDKAWLHLQPKPGENSTAALYTNEDGGGVSFCAPDGIKRGNLCATKDGGQLALFNDLGIERVVLGSADDGGGLKLNWGGTIGVMALATHQGGAVIVNDEEGKPRASLPPRESEEE